MLGEKNRKGDTEGKEAGNERTKTFYQPHMEKGWGEPSKEC